MGRARENNKKAGKIISSFPGRAIPRAFAVVSSSVPRLSGVCFPVCLYLPTLGMRHSRRTPAGLETSESASHSRRAAVCFCSCDLRCSASEYISPLVVSIVHPWFCTIPGAHLGSTARIQRDIRADCFCSCTVRCCRAECVSLVSFNVQSDIFAVIIAWS